MHALLHFSRPREISPHARASLRHATRATLALQVLFAAATGTRADVAPATRAPKIIQQPVALTVEQGQSASFKVELDPNPELKSASTLFHYSYGTITYQWMKNGARLAGATSAA